MNPILFTRFNPEIIVRLGQCQTVTYTDQNDFWITVHVLDGDVNGRAGVFSADDDVAFCVEAEGEEEKNDGECGGFHLLGVWRLD